MTAFYLGTHQPGWLSWLGVPLFVSDRRLRAYKTLPRAAAPWALDSGGFTELSTHGSWEDGPTPAEYVERINRYARVVGQLQWAAPQDWMCEPFMLTKTGLTVAEHQWRTTKNYLSLRYHDATLPIIPVLQGWTRDDYLRHVDQYARFGIDLPEYATVGVGSVCRRQHTDEAVDIFRSIAELGIRAHGFGLKAKGIAAAWPYLASADSLAWSYDARRIAQRRGSCGRLFNGKPIKSCANCRHFALDWYERATHWQGPIQMTMDVA